MYYQKDRWMIRLVWELISKPIVTEEKRYRVGGLQIYSKWKTKIYSGRQVQQ